MKIMIKCDLTNEEKIAVGDELSKAQADLEAVESEKKLQNGVLNGRIKGLKGRVHELSQEWITGAGEREEDVEEMPSPDGLKMIQTRISDGVKVGERPLNDNDRQLTISTVKGLIKKAEKSKEQEEAKTPEEAEQLRADRLEAEHAERILAAMSIAKESVTVAPGEPDGYIARLDYMTDAGAAAEMREVGATEDEAKEKLLALYASTLPKFVRPEPINPLMQNDDGSTKTPEQLKEDADERARREEIAKLAGEQNQDAKATRIAAGGGLQVPKGKGRKKRMTVVDGAGNELSLDAARSPAEQVKEAVDAILATARFRNLADETVGEVQFADVVGEVKSMMMVTSSGTDEKDARFTMMSKLTEYAAERIQAGARLASIPTTLPTESGNDADGLAF